jgi:hypothetical protein
MSESKNKLQPIIYYTSAEGHRLLDEAIMEEIALQIAQAPIYLVDEVGQWEHNTEETKKAWDKIKAKGIKWK